MIDITNFFLQRREIPALINAATADEASVISFVDIFLAFSRIAIMSLESWVSITGPSFIGKNIVNKHLNIKLLATYGSEELQLVKMSNGF